MLSGCKDNTFFLIPQKNHSQMDVVKKMRLLFNSSYILAPLQTQRAKNLTEEEQPHLFYNPIWKNSFRIQFYVSISIFYQYVKEHFRSQ